MKQPEGPQAKARTGSSYSWPQSGHLTVTLRSGTSSGYIAPALADSVTSTELGTVNLGGTPSKGCAVAPSKEFIGVGPGLARVDGYEITADGRARRNTIS